MVEGSEFKERKFHRQAIKANKKQKSEAKKLIQGKGGKKKQKRKRKERN